jgi:DNA polymerase-3 subunit delta'
MSSIPMFDPVFDALIGNEKAKCYLTRIAQRGTVGNSLLFAGPEGVGKSLFAKAFAKMLFCQNDPDGRHRSKIEAGNHPDLHFYRPEGKSGMHSLAGLREFSEQVYLAPFEAPWKIFIIEEADRMLSYSANALLKTFEEPAQDALILLISSTPAALLPTVLSRCRTLYFHPLSQEEMMEYLKKQHNKSEEEAQLLAAMAQGSIGQALRLISGGANPLRKQMLDFLSKEGCFEYRSSVETAALLAQQIEAIKTQAEEQVRTSLLQGAGETLTATQKQAFEKEIEGIIALQGVREAGALFDTLFSWYRDMQLLHLNGSRSLLMNPDYQHACLAALEKGKLLPLEKVEKALDEARLAIERSTSPQISLEGLFLKLCYCA